MMKYFKLNLIFLLAIGSLYAKEKQAENTSFTELHKKSIHGFVVPYVLRYDPDKWLERSDEGSVALIRSSGGLKVIIYEIKEKSTHDQLNVKFQDSLKNGCSDSSFYSGVEIIPSQIVSINGISFLHQKAIINLAPHSRHYRKEGKNEYLRRIGENGTQDQLEFYIGNTDKGRVSLCIDSTHIISPEEQMRIDELLRGFSFDGSACRGPKKLRTLKTVFEALTNQ